MFSLDDYIATHSTPESPLFADITRHTNLHILNPHMLSGAVQGELLRMISRMLRPRRILELGTYTGYSALCLAEGSVLSSESDIVAPTPELITIERNDELEETIRHNLALSPLGKHIRLLIGDAKQLIPTLAPPFDLVFIDADKREYSEYYDLVFPLVRPGGFILADNTLWDGHVIDPAYDREPQTIGLRLFNDKIKDDPRVTQVILPIRDGLTIIYKTL